MCHVEDWHGRQLLKFGEVGADLIFRGTLAQWMRLQYQDAPLAKRLEWEAAGYKKKPMHESYDWDDERLDDETSFLDRSLYIMPISELKCDVYTCDPEFGEESFCQYILRYGRKPKCNAVKKGGSRAVTLPKMLKK
jgi:hypothetical protein